MLNCPHCLLSESVRPKVVRRGTFWRKSDGRAIQRFRCLSCTKGFSRATIHPCYRQNKRQMNEKVRGLLSSGVSQRRIARLLRLSRTTVVRKFLFIAKHACLEMDEANRRAPPAMIVEFDDLETIEHTKLKPLSVTVAVESKTRRILGFEVSQMPANGLLARRSIKKYGPRRDQRSTGRRRLFQKIKPFIAENAELKSDENPHYPSDVARYLPECQHVTFKGQRGSTTGQGELKKVRFDPLFSLNHTCAMLRANVNRLIRKTWCTTKRADRLQAHLAIYAHYHNQRLI